MREQWKRKRWQPYALIGLLVVILLSGFLVFHEANKPVATAQDEAVGLAKKYAHLKTVDHFYWFNRQKSYFTVAGTTQDNTRVYVIIAQKGGKIRVIHQADGLSRNAALKQVWQKRSPKKVYNINLGLYQGQPAWEVSYREKNGQLGYETLAFKNGKQLKLVENL
ncbi:DUF5590 domain-containing protein [Loigolactobacillus backii]|uniref:Cell wall elongation regulator TseB-like domain-containing protein n=1 Tax=Loigolactobacillus backii TaxID=375175 RepID=A0A192H4K8_9LACO|nr:DUF5590 domain-containing protein [Loigolactobacillus backii]ANK59528.1 hypothetical protein AYR52_04265 [Loigolactobacillus backii]ANK62911.1 hypothetical protein AYR53_09140 [Loigolactobacillus backii]ANK64521.1 hypothetical protein AYR54_04270 [Loigolactobacillus backii]ANK67083.1 hypothetical protein AYR55_04760 [Loigolactobacillus backii]ANK70081.1 hypothetical protein AYR56_07865 [Loigolactobacillus backii]